MVIEGKKKVLDEITAAAKLASRVLLAPDPDREGEAIAWHLAEEVRPSNNNIFRVLFNEITKKAITESIGRPMALNVHKFESQQARRILDRLVGYQISPVLWTKVKRGLSAGRVQSVAVRLVVEREAEIKASCPREYWTWAPPVEGGNPLPSQPRVSSADAHRVGRRKRVTAPPGGWGIPSLARKSSNRRRSSARSMASTSLPIKVAPARANGSARLIAVCPPN